MDKIYETFQKIRKVSPIIHHITNWVTISDCANIVKVIGGSPVMAHAIEEAYDMAAISSAVVLNIGTLDDRTVEAMKLALKAANKKDIPVVIDAVGVGATKYRNETIKELLKYEVAVIKGNFSEIASTAGVDVKTKGVDTGDVVEDIATIAAKLAKKQGCVVVATGKEDICTDGKEIVKVRNGSPMMTQIVGTGCMTASVIGTFCAVEKDYLFSSVAGLVCFEIAAESVCKISKGIASFKIKIFDTISKLSEASIKKMKKVKKMRFKYEFDD